MWCEKTQIVQFANKKIITQIWHFHLSVKELAGEIN